MGLRKISVMTSEWHPQPTKIKKIENRGED